MFFSDHREALGERNYVGHDVYLNSWMSDVLLLLWAPHIEGSRSEAAVSTASIAPTVLHFLGLPRLAGMTSSLLQVDASDYPVSQAFALRLDELFGLTQRPPSSRPEFEDVLHKVQQGSQSYASKIAFTSSRYRLIVNRLTGLEALYDRERDPNEGTNLLLKESKHTQELREFMRSWHTLESRRLACLLREIAP